MALTREERDCIAAHPLNLDALYTAAANPPNGVRQLLELLAIAPASRFISSRGALYHDIIMIRKVYTAAVDVSRLLQSILQRAPDRLIWGQVIALIRSLCAVFGPRRDAFVPRYQGIQGFHEKYFQGRLERRAKQYWKQIRSRHNGRWANLSDEPEPQELYHWWINLAATLPPSRYAYCWTKEGILTVTESLTPLESLIIADSGQEPWDRVLVVGHSRKPVHGENASDQQRPLASYMSQIYAQQPTRRFVHGFSLSGANIQTWVYDRAGAYATRPFNIHHEPERFIELFYGYVMMHDHGLDHIQRKQDRRFVTIPSAQSSKPITFELGTRLALPCGLFGGTTAYRARVHERGTDAGPFNLTVKLAWSLRAEADLLHLATEPGDADMPLLLAHEDRTSIAELRAGLDFPSAVGAGLSCVPNLILRVVASSPAGRPLSQFASMRELLDGLQEAIQAHWALFGRGILHRDISASSITLTNWGGRLIDLDLALDLSQPAHILGAGTSIFQAIGVLKGGTPTYRHDLESFFYVLLWICIRHGWRAGDDPHKRPRWALESWYRGSWGYLLAGKAYYMHPDNFEQLLRNFPPALNALKPLCRTWRDLLSCDDWNDLSHTKPLSSTQLYDSVMAAFDGVRKTLKEAPGPIP